RARRSVQVGCRSDAACSANGIDVPSYAHAARWIQASSRIDGHPVAVEMIPHDARRALVRRKSPIHLRATLPIRARAQVEPVLLVVCAEWDVNAISHEEPVGTTIANVRRQKAQASRASQPEIWQP